jgi:hypothetical protein
VLLDDGLDGKLLDGRFGVGAGGRFLGGGGGGNERE